MENNRKSKRLLIVSLLLFLFSAFFSLLLGAAALSPLDLWRGLWNPESLGGQILWYVRLPRTLTTLLCGAALATSGAVLQGVLHNPLAGPNIIGVNGGAGLGAVLCMWLFPASSASLVGGFAFAGAFCMTLAVYFLSLLSGSSRISLVLSGVALGSFATAAIDAITTLNPDVLSSSSQFKMGGAANVSLASVHFLLLAVPFALAAVWALRRELSVLRLGDEVAQSLGMRPGRFRALFLFLACLLAAAAVSVMGLIGFVGLLIPHLVQMLSREEEGCFLPCCSLLGGAFLTLCDLTSRMLFSPFELPVGILLSFLGVPFFLLLLVRRRAHD